MTEKTIEERIEEYRAKNAALAGDIPEAGGIAYATVYLKDMPINVTARATNAYDAIASLAAGISLAKIAMGVTTEKVLPVVQNAPVPQQEAPQAPQQVQSGSSYAWKMNGGGYDTAKGKLHLLVPAGMAEPNEIACPLHPNATFKRRANDRGSWYSHKDGDGWCQAAVG